MAWADASAPERTPSGAQAAWEMPCTAPQTCRGRRDTEEQLEQSAASVFALLESVGLTLDAAVAFKRYREGGSDAELFGLLVGVLARELAEEAG
jgi:hypothetical protein